MTRNSSASLALVLLTAAMSSAQTTGYISAGAFNSFNSSTGAIISSFGNGVDQGQTFAVSPDGATLYVPSATGTGPIQTGLLEYVSSATGDVIQSVPLTYPASKVILNNDASTAYVLTQGIFVAADNAVDMVDLASGTVTGTISIPFMSSVFTDIAVSPDGSRLFISAMCFDSDYCTQQQPPPCGIRQGIHIFNASTLACETQVGGPNGSLSISQDGDSLYVTAGNGDSISVVNTQTLAQTTIALNGGVYGSPVVAPRGQWAVVFANSDTAYILDTRTNTIGEEFLSSLPGGSQAGPAVFSPGGREVWVALSCVNVQNCSLPDNAPEALAGFAFPSGILFAETPLGTPGTLGFHNIALAFPQVLRPGPAN